MDASIALAVAPIFEQVLIISSMETNLQIMQSNIEKHWRHATTIIFESRWILSVWLRGSGSNGTTDLLIPFRGRLTLAQAGTGNPSDP